MIPFLNQGFRLLGIEFAPLLLPLKRRLQTFGAFFVMNLILFTSLSFWISIYFLYNTQYSVFIYLYIAWMIIDRHTPERGGRPPNTMIRNCRIWRWHSEYFPVKIVKTCELKTGEGYLLGYHPHGVLAQGAIASFSNEGTNFSSLYPGLKSRIISHWLLSYLPISRELSLELGTIPATKGAMSEVLKNGENWVNVLVVGGGMEAINWSPDSIELFINERKGFIKLALVYGRHLVPSFAFGESDLFHIFGSSFIKNLQKKFTKYFGVAPLFFNGRGIFQYTFGFLPFRRPITVVIGKPIILQKTDDPSSELIEATHKLYVEELINLYETYNPIYGQINRKLIIG